MKKEKRSSRLSLKQNYFFYLMILPTLLYLLIFQIYPIIETVRISFTNWLLTDQSSGGYVGFANYTRLFTQDSNFWTLCKQAHPNPVLKPGRGFHCTAIFLRYSDLRSAEPKNAGAGPLARADDGPLGHPYGNRRINMALDV